MDDISKDQEGTGDPRCSYAAMLLWRWSSMYSTNGPLLMVVRHRQMYGVWYDAYPCISADWIMPTKLSRSSFNPDASTSCLLQKTCVCCLGLNWAVAGQVIDGPYYNTSQPIYIQTELYAESCQRRRRCRHRCRRCGRSSVAYRDHVDPVRFSAACHRWRAAAREVRLLSELILLFLATVR
jgi:hypothetical protein